MLLQAILGWHGAIPLVTGGKEHACPVLLIGWGRIVVVGEG
jgi:hypothetical protein